MENNTESIILDTARNHFVQKGFVATRMQEIADDAGINKALLHYYFRSKDQLYQKILSQMLSEFLPLITGAMAVPGSFLERSDRVIDTYLKTFKDNPYVPMFLIYEISQQKENFIQELRNHEADFQGMHSFLQQMNHDMEEGKIKRIAPIHLMLNILGMTIFPFLAQPMISTVFKVSQDQFDELMAERKEVIMNFIISATKI